MYNHKTVKYSTRQQNIQNEVDIQCWPTLKCQAKLNWNNVTIWFKETTKRSIWNIGQRKSQLQHLMLSQIVYVELNLASDIGTSGGCHLFFNDYQP